MIEEKEELCINIANIQSYSASYDRTGRLTRQVERKSLVNGERNLSS